MWWHLNKNAFAFISYTFFIKMRQLNLIFSRYFLFYFCTNEKIQLKYYFPSLFWSFQADSIIKWTSHNKLLLIFAQWKTLFPRRSSMILHAEKSAGTPTCTQPVLEGQPSPDTPAQAPQAAPVKDSLGCLDSLESEWTTARMSKEIWVFRRSSAQGFAYCLSTGARSHCSTQLCHPQQCHVSQRPGGSLNHLVAQLTALPMSCCQCLLLWNCLVLCNDSIGSHFFMRGTVGPPSLASCVSDILKLHASTQPMI